MTVSPGPQQPIPPASPALPTRSGRSAAPDRAAKAARRRRVALAVIPPVVAAVVVAGLVFGLEVTLRHRGTPTPPPQAQVSASETATPPAAEPTVTTRSTIDVTETATPADQTPTLPPPLIVEPPSSAPAGEEATAEGSDPSAAPADATSSGIPLPTLSASQAATTPAPTASATRRATPAASATATTSSATPKAPTTAAPQPPVEAEAEDVSPVELAITAVDTGSGALAGRLLPMASGTAPVGATVLVEAGSTVLAVTADSSGHWTAGPVDMAAGAGRVDARLDGEAGVVSAPVQVAAPEFSASRGTVGFDVRVQVPSGASAELVVDGETRRGPASTGGTWVGSLNNLTPGYHDLGVRLMESATGRTGPLATTRVRVD
jgi:hypothetical protein